jgi:hypothetical protein
MPIWSAATSSLWAIARRLPPTRRACASPSITASIRAGFGRGWSRFGAFGRGRSAFFWGWDDPLWLGDDIEADTVYTSFVDVDIRRAGDGKSVFEGTAKARSRSDDLKRLVPNLVEAVFTSFPGHDGETVRITVPPPSKPPRG